MIDWYGLVGTGLWVTGIATILASFSWRFYAASLARTGLRAQLSAPSFTLAGSLGMVLLLAGLTLRRGGSLWTAAIWALLALGFVYVGWLSFRAWRHQSRDA